MAALFSADITLKNFQTPYRRQKALAGAVEKLMMEYGLPCEYNVDGIIRGAEGNAIVDPVVEELRGRGFDAQIVPVTSYRSRTQYDEYYLKVK